MNKVLIISLLALIALILLGCTQSTPICGDGICSDQESNMDSSYYCTNDCSLSITPKSPGATCRYNSDCKDSSGNQAANEVCCNGKCMDTTKSICCGGAAYDKNKVSKDTDSRCRDYFYDSGWKPEGCYGKNPDCAKANYSWTCTIAGGLWQECYWCPEPPECEEFDEGSQFMETNQSDPGY